MAYNKRCSDSEIAVLKKLYGRDDIAELSENLNRSIYSHLPDNWTAKVDDFFSTK